MKIVKYPDNTSYVVKEDLIQNYAFKINSYEDLWHLNQLVDVCNNKGIKPVITIPNLIDAQADKRFDYEQSTGLKLVCKFLNGMKADFRIFHPHNPEVVEALMDNIEIIDNSNFILKVLKELSGVERKISYIKGKIVSETLSNSIDDLILMSSDAGGFKPLMKLCDEIGWSGETFSASKYRYILDGKTKLSQIIDREDFGGKDILIVDDISVYGGTFKGLSKILREKNCGKLYLAVSHMTVQHLGDDPITNYFDKVFTTNSKFDNYVYTTGEDASSANLITVDTPKNLEIIKLF